MTKQKDLFETLWQNAGCEYMSDLKAEPYRSQIPMLLAALNIEDYPLSAFEDLSDYLGSRRQTFTAYEQVKIYFS